ncbi:membrane protein [Kribbella alba]|uniref:Membrane protein n=1 Tax=Kribbella alba TaxID=190197 RepID=A0ABN2FGE4_9ACTN
MELAWVIVAVAAVLLLLGAYGSWTAGRLDRLHHRVATARAALETELARRSALVAELAGSGVLDPASSLLLLDAAHRARAASEEEREHCESALTRAIGATGTDAEPWASELGLAMRRVQMARRFHNDIVVSTRELRRRRLVTWFRLAGHAPMPGTIELEDGS